MARALGFGTVRGADEPATAGEHFALIGCGGDVPSLDECRDAARHLRPEGWLTLFGLPHDRLREAFEPLAHRGFVLSSSGRVENWSYLSGSILRLSAFLR